MTVLEQLFTYADAYVWPKTGLRLLPELGNNTQITHFNDYQRSVLAFACSTIMKVVSAKN